MVFYQTYTLNGGHVDWSTSLVKAKSLGREQGGDYRDFGGGLPFIGGGSD